MSGLETPYRKAHPIKQASEELASGEVRVTKLGSPPDRSRPYEESYFRCAECDEQYVGSVAVQYVNVATGKKQSLCFECAEDLGKELA